MKLDPGAPIGVFDSGIGGLSVLAALREELPGEDFVYFADSGNAPYGERSDDFVLQRTSAITHHLRAQHRIKALVIACNTATAAAVAAMRQAHPDLPIVGVEPALKPAAAFTHTGHIGVLATRSTLNSAKFQALLKAQPSDRHFICQPCDGLAGAIEATDAAQTQALCQRYTQALGSFGAQPPAIDTLVLGCTHYPFVRNVLQTLVGPHVHIIDSGKPVARHTHRLLQENKTLRAQAQGQLQLYTTGAADDLKKAVQHWLDWQLDAQSLAV